MAAPAGLKAPEKQVERLTERIGRERVDRQEQAVREFLDPPLMKKFEPPIARPPDLAVVEMDGGRLQTLDRGGSEAVAGAGAEASARRGHRRGDKIGLLMTMTGPVFATGPCPEVPESFVDPTRVLKLAREIESAAAAAGGAVAEPIGAASGSEEGIAPDAEWGPKPPVQTTAAGRGAWDEFRDVPAQAARARGFAAARRKAFAADGAAANRSTHKKWFSEYVPILDFIHAPPYVSAAATAGRPFRDGRPVYVRWVGLVWGGRVEGVVEELTRRGTGPGLPRKDDPEASPRKIVAEALSRLSNHQDRMCYDGYRRKGLPMTPSHMESTVKRFNRRVKGTEKFRSEEGSEAILKLRADHLSETEPLDAFWKKRQDAATGRRPYRRSG